MINLEVNKEKESPVENILEKISHSFVQEGQKDEDGTLSLLERACGKLGKGE